MAGLDECNKNVEDHMRYSVMTQGTQYRVSVKRRLGYMHSEVRMSNMSCANGALLLRRLSDRGLPAHTPEHASSVSRTGRGMRFDIDASPRIGKAGGMWPIFGMQLTGYW